MKIPFTKQMIAWHLEYRMKVPQKYIQGETLVAMKSIEEVNANRFTTEIQLPEGAVWKCEGKVYTFIPAYVNVALLELLPWLRDDLQQPVLPWETPPDDEPIEYTPSGSAVVIPEDIYPEE